MSSPYDTDGAVVTYNGEMGNYDGYVGNPSDSTCISNENHTDFSINGQYVGASSCGLKEYLTYDGHPGCDYPVPFETPVYAAASGTIKEIQCPTNGSACTDYGRIRIDHGNGYTSWYLHLSSQVGGLAVTDTVEKGDLIGYSGDTIPSPYNVGYHLHFEVRKEDGSTYGIPVDPYGWTGGGSDPYTAFPNTRLWE
jgi:murein DD-endopeptidase MepM/ murein hydrolase activator NlpD